MSRRHVLMYPAHTVRNDNPFIKTLSEALIMQGVQLSSYNPSFAFRSAPVMHVHWPERVFHNRLGSRFSAVADFYARNMLRTMERIRDAGGKVVWTAHNLEPHDAWGPRQKEVWNLLRQEFFRKVTDVAMLSSGARITLLRSFPELSSARFHTVMHQNFINYFGGFQLEDTRSRLGFHPQDTVFLTFGYIKRYKRVSEMIREFRSAKLKASRLVVAGRIESSYRRDVEAARGSDERVVILDYALGDQELASLIKSSNACVFNFCGQFNSGSLITSLSIGTPAIFPKFEAGAEIAERIGNDYTLQVRDALTSADFVEAARRYSNGHPLSALDLSFLDPEVVARRHISAYGMESD